MSVARIGDPHLPNRREAYSEPSTLTVRAAGAASPITVPGLVEGHPYNYLVTATHTAGSRAVSPIVLGVPKPPSAPGTTIISLVDAGDGEQNFFVSVPDDGGLAISSYRASCSSGADTSSASSTTPSVTLLTGLTNGVPYSCLVTVTNDLGSSPGSEAIGGAPEEAPITLPLWIFVQGMSVNAVKAGDDS